MEEAPAPLPWRNVVSILDRLIPNRHLSDAALADVWTAASGNPATAPHLESCADCRERYEALTAWLDEVRDEATAEADAAFPADRLAAQHAHILNRLEAMDRPVRVITFPKFARPIAERPAISNRWIAVAAAAGLVIGVAIGQWMDFPHRFGPQPTRTPETAVTATAPVQQDDDVMLHTASRTISDEALLSELEAALAMTPSVEPLRAIDTITPRSRDFVDRAR